MVRALNSQVKETVTLAKISYVKPCLYVYCSVIGLFYQVLEQAEREYAFYFKFFCVYIFTQTFSLLQNLIQKFYTVFWHYAYPGESQLQFALQATLDRWCGLPMWLAGT